MDISTLSSINQTSKHPLTTSNRYSFIPTRRVLDVLAGHGWQPVKAQESQVKNPENHGYQRHLVRLRNDHFSRELLGVGDVLPEIALVNSHGGGSSFQLYVALLEKVCSNGLIVERGTASHYRISHTGYTDSKVSNAIDGIVHFFPEVLARRQTMKAIMLDRNAQDNFARIAARLRFGDQADRFFVSELLTARRSEQSESTLWNTLNVVQEHLVRGGLRYRTQNGRSLRSRPVHAISDSTKLNRDLWKLAELTAQTLA